MDSRVVHSHVEGENDEQNSPNVEPYPVTLTHGPEEPTNSEPEPEKKSVMSRVKAKARKVRDSIKKHGQNVFDHGSGHDTETQHIPDDDGDLDEDKPIVQDQKNREVPNYDSEDVKSATPTPESEKVENLGNSGIGFEGTKFTGQEPHHAPLVEGVSSTTETTDKAETFVLEDKVEKREANLERQIDLEEDSQEQGSRAEAYTFPTYQTKDTNPNEEGSDEIKDITPLEESLERMNVHDESKPTTEPKIQSYVADTEYPSDVKSHDQFVPHFTDATKTQNEYPQETLSTDINRDQKILEEDSQDQGSRTETYIHPNYQTKDTDPSGAESNETKDITPLEESLERMNVHDDEPNPTTETKIQPFVTDIEYPSAAGSHDQFAPHFANATETQNEYPRETASTDININHEIPSETEKSFNAVTNTVGNQSDATEIQNEYPQETTSADINRNHEIPSETEETFNTFTNDGEKQAYYDELVEMQSKSHTDEVDVISSGTKVDKTLPFENDETSKLSNDGTSTGSNEGTGTQNEYPRETASTDININHEIPSETEKSFNAVTNTVENQSEATEIQNEYPQETVSSDVKRNHEIPSETEETFNTITYNVENQSDAAETQSEYPQETVSTDINRNHEIPFETVSTDVTNTGEKQAYYDELVEMQSKSHTDEVEVISSGTKVDKTLPLENKNDETSKLSNDGTSIGSNEGTETKNGDKGASVKDYLAEKLRPSEEDKALSEVVSEALHKGKEEPLKKEDGILASEDEKSEKVLEESNANSSGKGMVDRVKDYYGSWFAKPEENQSPQGVGIGEDLSKNKDHVAEVEQVGKGVDEGRTHE
ncbi:low-temperature-induced 65 kDa protein [Medicago truncatula]|nr:low-temperature-induced 65 kDa protein [Medicago truncatula]KEH43709.1 hypothetical protein MTR_1g100623 [Medicago truncatula]